MTPQKIGCLLVVALLQACSGGSEDVPSTFAIATGGPAGLYYPYGGGLASMWSKHLDQVNAKAEVTGGSVVNVIQVARRESEMGIAMADVVTAAYNGSGRFPEPLPLRVLFAAYPNIVHMLTLRENGIVGVGDLVGKRVSLGAAGSGTAVAAENVLSGLGFSLEDIAPVYLSFAETTSALKDGTIDAGFVVGGLGIAAVTELSVTRNLHLIPLSTAELGQLTQAYPTYAGYEIPGGTYSGVDQGVQALGIWSAVVVHEDFPEQVAFDLVCTLYAEQAALLKVARVAQATTVTNIAQVATVPLHPGTQAYLDRLATEPELDCSS